MAEGSWARDASGGEDRVAGCGGGQGPSPGTWSSALVSVVKGLSLAQETL